MKLALLGCSLVISAAVAWFLSKRRERHFGADLTHQRAHEAWTGRKWGEPGSEN